MVFIFQTSDSSAAATAIGLLLTMLLMMNVLKLVL